MNSLTPQINEIVTDLFDKGYYPEDLTKPFSNRLYWWQSPAYDSVKLNFDSAEMKISGWLSSAEFHNGSDEAFNTALIDAFKQSIAEQWALRMAMEIAS